MADPYASNVLDPDVHARLVADIDNIALQANIQPRWIWARLDAVCGPEEVEWVRRFRFHAQEETAGLCYVGRDPTPDIETRMAAIAGALTRNFVRARLMTVHAVIEALGQGEAPATSCLLVPNFFVDKAQGGGQPAWRVSALLDLLMQQLAYGVPDRSGACMRYNVHGKREIRAVEAFQRGGRGLGALHLRKAVSRLLWGITGRRRGFAPTPVCRGAHPSRAADR